MAEGGRKLNDQETFFKLLVGSETMICPDASIVLGVAIKLAETLIVSIIAYAPCLW